MQDAAILHNKPGWPSSILPHWPSSSLVGPRHPSLALGLPRWPSASLVGPRPPSLALGLPRWPSSSLVGPRPPSLALVLPRWPSSWPSSSLVGPRPPSLIGPRTPLLALLHLSDRWQCTSIGDRKSSFQPVLSGVPQLGQHFRPHLVHSLYKRSTQECH